MPWLTKLFGTLYVWSILRECRNVGWDVGKARDVARREVWAVPESIRAYFLHQKTEADILTERLGRRYDLGSALNEAANRAMEDKRVQREAQPLTATQEAALKVQREYLQHIVERDAEFRR